MTLDELAEKMRPLHNQICMLYDRELVRLVGVAQDEHDFYYIVRNPQAQTEADRDTFASAVGHCYGLKEHLPTERYARTDALFALNGAVETETFAVVDETAGETYQPVNRKAP
jgi:hypothetical protein